MLMSHTAISSGVAGCPRSGVSASATVDTTSNADAALKCLRIDMPDLPVLADRPAGDAVEVIERLRAAFGDQRCARRLDIPGTVCSAALQHRRAAVPAPRYAEPGQRLCQDRVLQRRQSPAFSAVSRDFDPTY